ncbi:hypothetical protein [Methylobacter sp. YRD-M1]|uniref:hypothetical protein n=1 Tax=Methylobacter sp. YRD-M1 TaxID=2911520 RepID=UPI00227A7423|nr:hypothetical protein [Methylobacter sp. YRD-M1]WAK02103.1 hypothetical protein LZ558_20185 [Methylobacter sp. YRD-M1]
MKPLLLLLAFVFPLITTKVNAAEVYTDDQAALIKAVLDTRGSPQRFCLTVSQVKNPVTQEIESVDYRCISQITSFTEDPVTKMATSVTVEFGPTYTTGREGVQRFREIRQVNLQLVEVIRQVREALRDQPINTNPAYRQAYDSDPAYRAAYDEAHNKSLQPLADQLFALSKQRADLDSSLAAASKSTGGTPVQPPAGGAPGGGWGDPGGGWGDPGKGIGPGGGR